METLQTNSLLGLTSQELTTLVLDSGQPAYRGQQLFDAVYRQRVETLEQISTLPQGIGCGWESKGWRIA
jgi:23S rRNA (adenine2503-C2)-methyltransferase